MAFICVFVSFLIGLLILKGQTLRRLNLISEKTEDGVDLMNRAETASRDKSNPEVGQSSVSNQI